MQSAAISASWGYGRSSFTITCRAPRGSHTIVRMAGLGALCAAVVEASDDEDRDATNPTAAPPPRPQQSVKSELRTPTPKKLQLQSPLRAQGTSATGSGDLGSQKGDDDEEPDPTKICIGCDSSVQDVTALEVAGQARFRAWGRRNHWGQFCFYCVRMSRIVWPHMKVPNLIRFIEVVDRKRIFKYNSLAFVSLREEGKCHIDLQMIDSRVRLLEKFGSFFANGEADLCKQYALAEDVAKISDNPVLQRQRLCQILVDGRRRLGFVVHNPMPATPISLPPVVVADPGLVTDEPNDLRLVLHLAEKATVALAAAATSPAKSPGAKALARSSSSHALRRGYGARPRFVKPICCARSLGPITKFLGGVVYGRPFIRAQALNVVLSWSRPPCLMCLFLWAGGTPIRNHTQSKMNTPRGNA